ncbi:PREDICTED: solute carrier organic anion transporter family member 4C1-like [Priapulus caudatus]|uniref:Solute carrier organic anion transporter family member 4C1-like n=1 Tax=Priapulus caudatus TaxID=37621 RepID=A0ABM1E6N0_PRICU|nr:PREDICTED: solute carrier organic anion transporter family member 4C1-like [Priapulus caudatus]
MVTQVPQRFFGAFTCVGLLIGGYVMRRFRILPKGGLVLILSCIISYAILIFFMMVIGCPDITYAGDIQSNGGNLTMECNSNCYCGMYTYSPVCGNNETYFSGCFAGCKGYHDDGPTKVYYDCSCIPGGTVIQGACPVSCTIETIIYVILITFGSMISTPAEVAAVVIQFRQE